MVKTHCPPSVRRSSWKTLLTTFGNHQSFWTKLDRKQLLDVRCTCGFFGPIRKQRWPPWLMTGRKFFRFLLCNSFMAFNETWQEASTLCLLSSLWVFVVKPSTKMAALASDWLRLFVFSSATLRGFERNLAWSKYWTSLAQLIFFRADPSRKMVTLTSDWLTHFWFLLCNYCKNFSEVQQKSTNKYLTSSIKFVVFLLTSQQRLLHRCPCAQITFCYMIYSYNKMSKCAWFAHSVDTCSLLVGHKLMFGTLHVHCINDKDCSKYKLQLSITLGNTRARIPYRSCRWHNILYKKIMTNSAQLYFMSRLSISKKKTMSCCVEKTDGSFHVGINSLIRLYAGVGFPTGLVISISCRETVWHFLLKSLFLWYFHHLETENVTGLQVFKCVCP